MVIINLKDNKMYVCVCNALNEKSVKKAALTLSSTLSITKLYEKMGARPQCGMCLCHAQVILDEARAEWNNAS